MFSHIILAVGITSAMIPPGTIAATAAHGHAITVIQQDGCQGGMLVMPEATTEELDLALRWMLKRGRFCDDFDHRVTVGQPFGGNL